MKNRKSLFFRLTPLLAAVAALAGLPASAYTWSIWDGTDNWSNGTLWSAGIPSGTDAGALVRTGTVTINDASGGPSVNAVLVGWTGTADVNMTGGSLTVTGAGADQSLSVGETAGFTGTFTQSGGAVTANVLYLGRGGYGVYNLNGGTLNTDSIYGLAGSGAFHFGTGTLVTSTGNLTLRNDISGYHPLALSGTNGFAGTVTIDSGFVQLNSDNALGSGALSFGAAPASGRASLNMNGFNQAIRGLTASSATLVYGDIYNHIGNATSTLTIDTPLGESYTYANQVGAIPGDWSNISLVKKGDGTQTLTGVNYFSGTTTISAGTLLIGNNGVTDGAIASSSSISNNAVLEYNLLGNQSYGNVISGTGTLIKGGVGTLTLTGANTYTGLTTVSQGTLQIGNNDAVASVGAGNYDIAHGAKLVFSRNAVIYMPTTLSISGAGDIELKDMDVGFFSFSSSHTGTLSNSGKTIVNFAASAYWWLGVLWLEKDDVLSHASVLDMEAGKVYTRGQEGAGLTVAGLTGNAGTYLTTDQGSNQKWTINVTNGQSHAYAGVIGADGSEYGNNNISLTKTGAGTQTLAGANTYTGTTTVSNGTLLVNGSLAAGSAVTVYAGGTLGGTGAVYGAVSVNADGRLAPGGTNSVGTLTCGGNLALAAGAVCDINYTNAVSDTVVVGGELSLPATLTVNLSVADAPLPQQITLFAAGSLAGATDLHNWQVSGVISSSKYVVRRAGTTVVATLVPPGILISLF